MRPRLLVVQNAPWEGPGLVGMHARASGGGDGDWPALPLEPPGARCLSENLEKGGVLRGGRPGSPSTAFRPRDQPVPRGARPTLQAHQEGEDPLLQRLLLHVALLGRPRGQGHQEPRGEGGGVRRGPPDHRRAGLTRWSGRSGPYTTLQWHGDIVETLPSGRPSTSPRLGRRENQVAVPRRDTLPAAGRRAGGHPRDGQELAEARLRSGRPRGRASGRSSSYARPSSTRRTSATRFLRIFGNFLALALPPAALRRNAR